MIHATNMFYREKGQGWAPPLCMLSDYVRLVVLSLAGKSQVRRVSYGRVFELLSSEYYGNVNIF